MSADKPNQPGRSCDRFRQRADRFDSRLGDDLADECHSEFGLAVGKHLHRARATLCEFDLRLHLLHDAELFQRFFKAHPCGSAARRIRIRDRLHRKQQLLHGVGRGNIRMRLSRPDCEAERHVGQRSLGFRDDITGRDHLRIRRLNNRYVERIALRDLCLRSEAGTESRFHLVSRLLFKSGNHLFDGCADSARCNERDVRRNRRVRSAQNGQNN